MYWRRPGYHGGDLKDGFIKINFDGSKTSQSAVGGFILRNWVGRFIQASAFNLGAASILVAEATAMRNGIKAAVRLGFKNIHVEGNNQILIRAIKDQIEAPWQIQTLVQDIKTYLQECHNIIITHIFSGREFCGWLGREVWLVYSIPISVGWNPT